MAALPFAMLAAGLASGVHCVAMCGGIVSAFDSRRVVPIVPLDLVPRAGAEAPARGAPVSDWSRRLLFNAGRISSYAAAGAVAGTAGAAMVAAGALPAQTTLAIAVNALLVLVGLYLAGAGRLLARLEALGAPLWRRLQRLAARLLPARTLPQAYAAGLVWGWLPCGMVYGALGAAAFAGGAAEGAVAMAAFGLGTLPWLAAAGALAARLAAWRVLAASLALGFGAFGLARASNLAEGIRHGLLCLQ